MREYLKKIILCVISFSVISFQFAIGISKVYAVSEEHFEELKKNYISEAFAYNIAQNFIVNSVEHNVSNNWNEYSEASFLEKCYDIEGNISAYIYNIKDTYLDTNCGYIVIGASEVYSPIIEFSEFGCFVCCEYLQEGDRLISVDGINYYGYSVIFDRYYELDEFANSIDITNINICTFYSKDIAEQWDNIYGIIDAEAEEILVDGLSGDSYYGNTDITYPLLASDADKIEGSTGNDIIKISSLPTIFYCAANFNNVSGYVEKKSCAPIAAINLMYYYYNKNTSYYSSLKVGKNTVNSTFSTLISLMKTNGGGTTVENNVNGIKNFLYNNTLFRHSIVNYTSLAALNATDMVADLKGNRPVILLTWNHEFYENHAMLCVGIREYDNGSLYYIVADGNLQYLRYMNCYTGNAVYTDMITVHLYK